MEIFENGDYKTISHMIEEKVRNLRKNTEFNQKYLSLTDKIDKLEREITPEQRNELNEIVKLFYELEEYYFAFSYSLGVKFGNDLETLN